MKIKEYPKDKLQDAREICAKIKEEAEYQARSISEQAQKEAEKILSQARAEAQHQTERMLKDLDKKLARSKEKILSTINLGKKRIFLEEKNKFAQQVLQEVIKQAQEFRNWREYTSFLKKAIVEGAGIIDSQNLEVFYSSLDGKLINDDFIKETTAFAANRFKKNFVFTFHQGDFNDIGVIMQSPDGRLRYDNRFMARLKRVYDDIYMRLLKESF